MNRLFAIFVVLAVVTGCSSSSRSSSQHKPLPKSAAPIGKFVTEHKYQNGHIRIGMSKAEVLRQISGATPGSLDKPYHANVNPSSLLGRDDWGLIFQEGYISLWFSDGKVTRIKLDYRKK